MADLQERIRTSENRLAEVAAELETLTTHVPDDTTVAAALAQFDQIWEVLSPREQSQLFHLLIERVGAPILADLDGDRQAELLVTAEDGRLYFLRGD